MGSVFYNFYPFHVRLPSPAGSSHRVADVIAKYRFLAAYAAFCHLYYTSYKQSISILTHRDKKLQGFFSSYKLGGRLQNELKCSPLNNNKNSGLYGAEHFNMENFAGI
jgi:hypothetical protein